jgi:hypothetical protein
LDSERESREAKNVTQKITDRVSAWLAVKTIHRPSLAVCNTPKILESRTRHRQMLAVKLSVDMAILALSV